MLEDVIKKLISFGYEPKYEERVILPFLIDKVESRIKNICNVKEVPKGLYPIAVDMVCGEFLHTARQNGDINEEFNIDDAIKTLQAGDTTIAFRDDGDLFGEFINSLKHSGDGEFSCYRKIRW